MKTYGTACAVILAVALAGMVGCSGSSDNQTPEQMREQAVKMSVDDLKAKAQACRDEIAKLQKKLDEIKAQIKPAELFTEQGKKLTAESNEVLKSIDNVKQRLQICVEELRKKGADVTNLLTY
jgi:hypothetical protein